MASKSLNPLDYRVPIVDSAGRPTNEFQRKWAQQAAINGGIPASASALLDALGAVRGDVLYRAGDGWAALEPGTDGQALLTGGPSADPRWGDVDVQSLLDGISTTQGTVLYRGAAAWEVLAPGTSGEVLTTGGAGADPSWQAAGGGGGGDLSLIASVTTSGSQTTVAFPSIPGTFKHLKVIAQAQTTASSGQALELQYNGDTAGHYYSSRVNSFGTTNIIGGTASQIGSVAGTGAPAGTATGLEILIFDYNSTVFMKPAKASSALALDLTSGHILEEHTTSYWSQLVPITSILFSIDSSSPFLDGSTFDLYGFN